MTQSARLLSISFLMMTILVACNHIEPVYNIENEAVPQEAQQHMNADKIGNVIANTALEKGWLVERSKPGLLRCTLKWQEHVAVIHIKYSNKDYSIELESSENLKAADGMIHPRYNKLIKQLEYEIDQKLSAVAFK